LQRFVAGVDSVALLEVKPLVLKDNAVRTLGLAPVQTVSAARAVA